MKNRFGQYLKSKNKRNSICNTIVENQIPYILVVVGLATQCDASRFCVLTIPWCLLYGILYNLNKDSFT